ncbi:MAG TPA: hypothetical protein DEQ34_02770 [Balneolaceae bacterium]|nr:hypothetical protein [Balneolaceae bacterium]|tara:strand:- start:119 stop:685 length:567 start_codon:yes stop_codon:yes gene_type:complete
MHKRSDFHFRYPPNIHELDLATMVNMFRSRGEPRKANPGEYFSCAITQELLKEGKWWFGLYYSQKTWDALLTKGCEGFPMTDAELNVLGLVYMSEDTAPHREQVEKNCGVTEKLAYLIVNDLRVFGFLSEDDSGFLAITPRGEKALHGIARRMYDKRFLPEMINDQPVPEEPKIEQAQKVDKEQTSLF